MQIDAPIHGLLILVNVYFISCFTSPLISILFHSLLSRIEDGKYAPTHHVRKSSHARNQDVYYACAVLLSPQKGTARSICCGSILSLAQFLFSFAFVYGNVMRLALHRIGSIILSFRLC